MIISYNNQTLNTEHTCSLTDEEFDKIKKQYFAKPDFELVKKQFISLSKGGVQSNYITDYYVKRLMCKTKLYSCKWTVEDVFNCKDLLAYFISKTKTNDKVFTSNDICKNIDTAIRLGGKGVAKKPTNFPIKAVDEVLSQYNVNNNWYDFSCGWGARLLGALKNNVNYFGTDPNYLLTESLNNLSKDYMEHTDTNIHVDIRTCGSEVFQSDWKNKMGLAFSSPPYYCLEDYQIGNQSYKNDISYKDWIKNYLCPTMKNIYQYLIKDGYFLLNINNFLNYHLVEDSIYCAEHLGFELVNVLNLKNIKRCKSNSGFNNNDEKILVFRKIINDNI